jgi:hypothetical protein
LFRVWVVSEHDQYRVSLCATPEIQAQLSGNSLFPLLEREVSFVWLDYGNNEAPDCFGLRGLRSEVGTNRWRSGMRAVIILAICAVLFAGVDSGLPQIW